MATQSIDLIYTAIDEVNRQSTNGRQIAKSPDTALMGGDSALDSLTFVNLIVAVESEIENQLNKSIVLVTESTMKGDEHPFRTVSSLAKLIDRMVA